MKAERNGLKIDTFWKPHNRINRNGSLVTDNFYEYERRCIVNSSSDSFEA